MTNGRLAVSDAPGAPARAISAIPSIRIIDSEMAPTVSARSTRCPCVDGVRAARSQKPRRRWRFALVAAGRGGERSGPCRSPIVSAGLRACGCRVTRSECLRGVRRVQSPATPSSTAFSRRGRKSPRQALAFVLVAPRGAGRGKRSEHPVPFRHREPCGCAAAASREPNAFATSAESAPSRGG